MKISALRLFNVKRFANRGVAIEGIGEGVNVLCAANEFGKSTSFEALHALFFQRHSGTPDAVRRLRPYSGGSPMVEADIATDKGDFRIAKKYYGGGWARVTDMASGRLIAQADEAETFIAELVKGGSAGPAGLLWVRQGITGIERRTTAEEEGEKQVRKSLLESVQGEVEAVTGGRRMAEIMAATEEALAALVTATGRPKTGGRYLAAIEERDKLAARERELAADVAVLRDALDKRAAAAKRLNELDSADERHNRRRAIEMAQSAFDAAKAHVEKLRTAETELQLALERHATADRELGKFRDASAQASELGEALTKALEAREQALARRRAAGEAIDKARTDAEAAEAQEQEARDLLARLDAALRARQASEELAGLRQRLGEAEAARHEIEQCEATQALVAIPADGIDKLQALEIDIAKLRAVEDAARPTVSVSYDDGVSPVVMLDGTVLGDGEERSYHGQARLVVPGLGSISLRSGTKTAVADDRLPRAEARRSELLSSLGVDSLTAARSRQAQAQQLASELRELRARLALLAPDGIARLREEIASRANVAGSEQREEDPAPIREMAAHARERRDSARQALREAEPQRASADERFIAAETSLATLQARRVQLDAILGPEDQRAAREDLLATVQRELAIALGDASTRVEALRAQAVDIETVEAALKRAISVDRGVEAEIGTRRQEIAELNGRIRTLADEAVEEAWRETADLLAAAKTRVAAFEKEVAVLQRLAGALDTARSQARDLYLTPVITELKPLLGLLFDDVSIEFDDKSLLPRKILRNGQEEDVERLSGGMREQLSVLTRLAFARLLARDGRPAPVILDDALVYSDDERIEKMFIALHRQARDQQIIVFSCRQRAFQELGGNRLHMADWQP